MNFKNIVGTRMYKISEIVLSSWGVQEPLNKKSLSAVCEKKTFTIWLS